MNPGHNDSSVVNLGGWAANQRLKDENEQLKAELEERNLQLLAARAALRAQAEQSGVTEATEPPPVELVHAIRSSSRRRHQPVWVNVDGEDMLILVDGAGHAPDPQREAHIWQHIRRLREPA